MATDYVFLKGKAMWARTQRPDEWGNYSVLLYPDAPSIEIIKKLKKEGLKNILKDTDDGTAVTFRRPTSKVIRGKVIGFTPVELLDKDGQPTDVAIGNGSDVTVKLEVYSHGTPGGGKAKAARLLGIRIDSLVPFEADRDFSKEKDQRLEQTEGLAEQPAQLF